MFVAGVAAALSTARPPRNTACTSPRHSRTAVLTRTVCSLAGRSTPSHAGRGDAAPLDRAAAVAGAQSPPQGDREL